MDHGSAQRLGQSFQNVSIAPSHSPTRQYTTSHNQNGAQAWPLSPQNTSALRSTVESCSRSAPHDDVDAHAFSAPSPYAYSPLNRLYPPSGRWMNPMMIRPIDSAYSASQAHSDQQQQQQMGLLPSPFPPLASSSHQVQQQAQYASSASLPPLPNDLVQPEYYSGSSSTSPSSMSSRSIETLDSPIALHQHTQHQSRYQHQHHHSEPYIYTPHSSSYGEDPFHNMSRQSSFQPHPHQSHPSQYPSHSPQSYAHFHSSLESDVYGPSHGASSKAPPTIESFNSAVVSASAAFGNQASHSRRKHKSSHSASDLDFFPQSSRTPRSTGAPYSRTKPVSPTRQRQRSQAQPFSVDVQYPQLGGAASSLLMLNIPPSSSSSVSLPAPCPPAPKPQVNHPFRTFPAHVQIDADFPLLYRKFHVPSYFAPNDPLGKFVFAENPEERPYPLQRLAFNSPSHSLDLYTPRYVKGSGSDKVGLCPICIEPISRGGEGSKLFLKTKVSAYNYHMQYYHGICARSNKPFSPPICSRVTQRPRATIKERKEIKEGKCHMCNQWVPLQGTKDVDVMVKEIFWWKHAASCHKGTNIEGETDMFVEDDAVYRRVREFDSIKMAGGHRDSV